MYRWPKIAILLFTGFHTYTSAEIQCETEFVDWSGDRGTYHGQCQNGVPHGQGIVEYFSGDTHTGEFEEDEIRALSECGLKDPCEINYLDPSSDEAWVAILHCPKIGKISSWTACEPSLVNYSGFLGATPLHLFALEGDIASAKSLLALGANINALEKDNKTPLHLAVNRGHFDMVNMLIGQGADLEVKENLMGFGAIHSTAFSQGTVIFEALVNAGADVNARDLAGHTPLHLVSLGAEGMKTAIRQGYGIALGDRIDINEMSAIAQGLLSKWRNYLADNPQITAQMTDQQGSFDSTKLVLPSKRDFAVKLDLLLASGADVNSVSHYGTTPLHMAATGGNLFAAKRLLAEGADANSRSDIGRTPLHLVADQDIDGAGNLEVAISLIERDADIHATTDSLTTSLHLAAWKGHVELVELLLHHGANIHARDDAGFTPLHNAVERGHIEVATLLLSKEARINEQTNDGRTALHLAVSSPNIELVKILLANGARTDIHEQNDTTAVHQAASYGRFGTLQLLLDHGADAKTYSADRGTPLHSVASGKSGWLALIRRFESQAWKTNEKVIFSREIGDENGYRKVLDHLLAMGLDISVKTQAGQTPLHVAAEGGNIYATGRLLALGADVNDADAMGWTPLHRVANGSGSVATAMLLHAADAQIDPITQPGIGSRSSTPLGFSAARGHVNLTKYLIDEGADINARNELGSTALHRAASWNHAAVIEVLLAGNENTDPLDNQGGTPLHVAAGSGHKEAAEVLLINGANPNAPGPMPQLPTPLHLAAFKGHADIVSLLLAHGASVSATTLQGKTPLDLAKSTWRKEIVELLQTADTKVPTN